MEQEAIRTNQLPTWGELTKSQRYQLVQTILEKIAEWKQIPPPLLNPLPNSLLKMLAQLMQTLKDEGLAGGRIKPTQRVSRIMELLRQRLPQMQRSLTEEEVLELQPKSTQQQIRGQEAIQIDKAEARSAIGLTEMLAKSMDNRLL